MHSTGGASLTFCRQRQDVLDAVPTDQLSQRCIAMAETLYMLPGGTVENNALLQGEGPPFHILLRASAVVAATVFTMGLLSA